MAQCVLWGIMSVPSVGIGRGQVEKKTFPQILICDGNPYEPVQSKKGWVKITWIKLLLSYWLSVTLGDLTRPCDSGRRKITFPFILTHDIHQSTTDLCPKQLDPSLLIFQTNLPKLFQKKKDVESLPPLWGAPPPPPLLPPPLTLGSPALPEISQVDCPDIF